MVEEAGPLRARVRLVGRIGTSRLRWTLSLLRDDPRVFMKLEINFDERFRLLQMLFNLAQSPRDRVEGVMGGGVARGLSNVEWPVHGWSRLSLEDADVALVTNDAYSVSVDANRWQWTLMRSPRMAWGGGEPAIYAGREWFTDQGIHELDFELRVGPELFAGDLTRAARRRGQPVITFDRYEGMNRPSFGAVPPRGMWFAGMKRNLADGRIKDPGTEANVATGLWAREDN